MCLKIRSYFPIIYIISDVKSICVHELVENLSNDWKLSKYLPRIELKRSVTFIMIKSRGVLV